MPKDMSILIVDDNLLNLRLLEKGLVKQGYRVLSAENGPRCRELTAEKQPDLILLDIMMPDEDGFEVIQQLKEDADSAFIPVIFLTGMDDINTKIRGFDLGAVDYITKPFHMQEVLARVRLHLKLSVATNSLIASQAEKLKQVKRAQKSMLVSPLDVPDAGFGVTYNALLEAGGDIYDVFKISNGIFGFFVGDVSGHDIETSYITASAKALLRQNCLPIYQPRESMRMMNNVLTEILTPGKYLTACYAKLNRRTMTMTIVCCGHPPVVHVSQEGNGCFVKLDGDVLGVFPNADFGETVVNVKKGDRFFLYTDGLVEKPEEGKVWSSSLDVLPGACEKLVNVPIRDAPDGLIELILSRNASLEDDIVILAIEV